MSTEDRATHEARRNQMLLFSGLAAAALIGVALWIGSGTDPAPPPRAAIDAELAGPGTAEETWIRRSETRMGGMEAQLRDLELANRQLADENGRLRDRLQGDADDARRTIVSAASIPPYVDIASAVG